MFAASHIASKKGSRSTSVFAGLIVSLTMGAIVVGSIALTRLPSSFPAEGIFAMVASGVFAPALARAAAIAAIDRLGPSTSVPIQASSYPLLAVLGALLLLEEPIGGVRLLGCGSIVAGVWLLARPRTIHLGEAFSRRSLRAGVLLAVLAGLSKGVADIVRKSALNLMPHATFGAAVGLATAAIAWVIAALLVPPIRSRVRFGDGAPWFALGGLLAGAAVLAQFHALRTGDVSVVSPIVAAQPIFVLLLSAAFLKDVETITRRTVTGVVLGVMGTALVSL